jgi:hypothetical protein
MNPNDESEFDESWRRAFDDAELPPPPDGWERVEPNLPPPRRWRAAFWWPLAAALLLLSGALGWWTLNPPTPEPTGPNAEVAEGPPRPLPAQANTSRPAPTETTAARPEGTRVVPGGTAERNRERSASFSESPLNASPKPAEARTTVQPRRSDQDSGLGTFAKAEQAQPRNTYRTARRTPEKRDRPDASPGIERSVPGSLNPEIAPSFERVPVEAVAVNFLDGKSFQPYAFVGTLRVPSLSASVPSSRRPPIVKPKTGPKFWVEGSAYVARFNPSVRTNRQLVTSAANYNNTSVSYDLLQGAYTNASRVDAGNAPALSYVSFVVDARTGMRLTNHWYLESGLQFLRGHSTLTSDVLLVDKNTSNRTSLYGQLLENTARQTTADARQLNSQNVVVPARNLFRYSFDYLAVPLALGYRIRLGKPINYTLSAGISGDVFLGNRLEAATDASIAPVRYGPGDGVYRRMALSAVVATGMELKLTRNWSLTARGLLRQGLTPGIRGGSSVQTYPHTLGVGLGGQYRF